MRWRVRVAKGEANWNRLADSQLESPLSSEAGERRHLTVLFGDLVGSTEIASRMDPEEWRDIAARYQRTAAECVQRFGGHVAKFLGDGVVCFFGWPQAHDDDAERAARAGLVRQTLAEAWERAQDGEGQVALIVGEAGIGRRDEARARLAPLYATFTEGFDTPDLQDAKALLDEL